MKLLLVEDEEDLARMLARALRTRGYSVDAAEDGEEALALFEINEYDLVILDLNIPKVDGLSVLRQIRAEDKSARVLILSARSKIEERVEGLDVGANDYLTKPFDFLELEARVRALLRTEFALRDTVVRLGALTLDTGAHQASVGEQSVQLTGKEYAVLEYLFWHQGDVVSASALFEHVWDSEADPFSNALKYHIHSLKKKLREAGAPCEYIRNLRGQGYILTEEADESHP